MTITTVWGYVSADGTVTSGTGFGVYHDADNSPGVYYIHFDQAFSDMPAVSITLSNLKYDPGRWGGVAFITKLTSSECEVVTTQDDFKTKQDSDFTVLAVGIVD